MKLLVRNGRVVTPGGSDNADISCVDGRIDRIEASIPTNGMDEVFDAAGYIVLPGLLIPTFTHAIPVSRTWRISLIQRVLRLRVQCA